jgi:hypothetical protein
VRISEVFFRNSSYRHISSLSVWLFSYLLRFPLNNLPEQFLSLQILWVHSIYDPFNIPDTRYLIRIGFRWRIHRPSIRANNFKFPQSILPFFTVLFTGKVQFGGERQILQAFGTVFASRDCITSLLTSILLYKEFTLEVPDHQAYIYYLIYLGVCTSDCAASPSVLFSRPRATTQFWRLLVVFAPLDCIIFY